MRSIDFLVEDFTIDIEEDFFDGYNKFCLENNLTITETSEGDNIRSFVSSYYIPISIGEIYSFVTLRWPPFSGHPHLSVANLVDQYELLDIEENGQLIVKNNTNGSMRKFPEIVGPVSENTTCSVLFNSDKEKAGFLLMTRLKFSDWKIDEKEK